MATIKDIMPYLEQGYMAIDPYRTGPAYLKPVKQGNDLVFEWTAYNMESEWAGPDMHTKAAVMKWNSDGWGIHCEDEDSVERPEQIEAAIREGRAYKAEGF